MSELAYRALWSDVEAVLRQRQPAGRLPAANGEGWIGPICSPIRVDRHPSFSVKPDSETDPGGWVDHATGDHGSIADLARLLGIEIKSNGGSCPMRPAPTTLETFALARHLDPVQMRDTWGVREGSKNGRRGLIYPTTTGVARIKYVDGAKPKYGWMQTGGGAHWYGLAQAAELASATPEAEQGCLVLANGEPSVWGCSQEGVAAVCLCAGEGTPPTPELVAELNAAGFDTVKVVYDRDDQGRKGALAAVAALRKGDLAAEAYELPADLGEHGDVDDLHRRVGERLAEVLGGLPRLETPAAEPAALDPVGALAELTPEACQDGRLELAMRVFGEAVGQLDAIGVATARERGIARLKQLGVGAPAKLVDAALPVNTGLAGDNAHSGQAPLLTDPDPWPDPVDGAKLLAELVATVQLYVVLPPEATVAVALWVVFTHAHDAFQVSPILALNSPEKQCGKTTLLTLLGALVPRPLTAANVTAAVVFRVVDAYTPTLLLDEADTFIRDSEELRGVLDSGHHRAAAVVPRCVGDEHEVRLFSTWAPKAVALIGILPSTLEDRSILVRMRRRASDERAERIRLDRLHEFEPLRQRAARWAADHMEVLRASDPAVPHEISSDRARDNWRPLLAIADLAGNKWPIKVREAAVRLTAGEAQSESGGVLLLTDLRGLFAVRRVERLSSEDVIRALREMEERPWPEWRDGRAITTRQVARLLKPFGIEPAKWRDGDKTVRGYVRETFADAFARYLPPPDPPQSPHDSGSTTYTSSSPPQTTQLVADWNCSKSFPESDVADVADVVPGPGEDRVKVPL